MNKTAAKIIAEIYEKLGFEISDFEFEREGKEYDAARFKLNKLSIISRTAKITPKKVGQFVTFWKRNPHGPIEPLDETDGFDFLIVNLHTDKKSGQFVFPKSILSDRSIISTAKKEGKRAFRVYPVWEITESKQAQRTQKWQLKYFIEIHETMDFKQLKELYKTER